MKVSIFGLGYVGCVTAACLSKEGHDVIGVDVVSGKVERLAAGLPTVIEPGLSELIGRASKSGKLTATMDGRSAVLNTDASLICVGTPNSPGGGLDLSAVEQTAQSFLREGTAIADYEDPPFVVIGSAAGLPDNNQAVLTALFGSVVDELHWLPFREAEMLKLACNAFHALKVAFSNEMGALCSAMAVDGRVLMHQLVQDHKLNVSPAYLRPGLAFGGSCLPKDLRMLLHLANTKNVDLPLLRSILPSNDAHLKRAMDLVPDNGMRRVGLNGLAFKAGTDDLRESPIVLIAEHLIGKGYDLKIHDAAIETSRITGANRDYIEKRIPHLSSRLVSTIDELIEHSEIVLITRDDETLLARAAQLGKRLLVIDLRGRSVPGRKGAPLEVGETRPGNGALKVKSAGPPSPRRARSARSRSMPAGRGQLAAARRV